IAQRASEPRPERNAKPGLRPLDERAGYVAVEHLPQHPLTLTLPELETEGQAPGELDDTVVEQRHASLQAHRHAGPVHLRQDVVGEVALQVEQHHLRGEVPQLLRSADLERGLLYTYYQIGGVG